MSGDELAAVIRCGVAALGDVERDSHAYRLGVATEIIRGWLEQNTPWMRQRAVDWLAGEHERTELAAAMAAETK